MSELSINANFSENLSLPEAAVQCFLYSGLIAAGLVLNGTIIWLVWTQKSLRTIINIWVTSLIVSQLLITVFMIPFIMIATASGDWIFGKEFCFLHGYLIFVFRTVSIFSVAAIALNRYHVISKPFSKRMRRKTVWILIGFLWWFAIVICTPPLFGVGSYRYSPTRHMCDFSWSLGGSSLIYISFYVTCVYVSTLLTASWSYVLIYKITKAHVHHQAISTISQSKSDNHVNLAAAFAQTQEPKRHKTNRFPNLTALRHKSFLTRDSCSNQSRINLDEKAGKLIIAILLVFLFAWTPYFILGIYLAAGGRLEPYSSASYWTDFTVTWISLSTCVWDPLLYGVYTKNFHGYFRKYFCFWKKTEPSSSQTKTACAFSGAVKNNECGSKLKKPPGNTNHIILRQRAKTNCKTTTSTIEEASHQTLNGFSNQSIIEEKNSDNLVMTVTEH